MSIFSVSSIVYAASIGVYLQYLTTYGIIDLDPMALIWALFIVVVLLSIVVGWLWPRGGGKR